MKKNRHSFQAGIQRVRGGKLGILTYYFSIISGNVLLFSWGIDLLLQGVESNGSILPALGHFKNLQNVLFASCRNLNTELVAVTMKHLIMDSSAWMGSEFYKGLLHVNPAQLTLRLVLLKFYCSVWMWCWWEWKELYLHLKVFTKSVLIHVSYRNRIMLKFLHLRMLFYFLGFNYFLCTFKEMLKCIKPT